MKNKTLVVVLVVVILGLLAYVVYKKPAMAPVDNTPVVTNPVITGDTANLASISITPGQVVANNQVINGQMKGSYFFEANMVGMLLDANKNVLKQFPITATSDWMTSDPVSFSFKLNLTGIPTGPGYIRLHNDNPSGLPANDKYVDIPVVF